MSHWTSNSGLSALLLFQAWRAGKIEHSLKPNDKKQNLLLDACHSLGKSYSAALLRFPTWVLGHSLGPGQALLVSSVRLALKRTQGCLDQTLETVSWARDLWSPGRQSHHADRFMSCWRKSWHSCGHLSTPSFPHDHILSHILMSLDGCCFLVNWSKKKKAHLSWPCGCPSWSPQGSKLPEAS